MSLDLYIKQILDLITQIKFRQILEQHQIGENIFSNLKERLDKAGLKMHGAQLVDAAIIHAPSSTKRDSQQISELIREDDEEG